MSQSLKLKKKKAKVNFGLTEVCVRLPKTKKGGARIPTDFFWSDEGRKAVMGKKAIYIPCANTAEVIDLKRRIGGKIKVPIERMQLFFVGRALDDDDDLPDKAFESNQDEESDNDLFRPRICLSIMYHLPVVKEEEEEDSLEKDSENGSIGPGVGVEEEYIGEEGAENTIDNVNKEDDTLADKNHGGDDDSLHHAHKDGRKFDFDGEMTAIECSNFIEHLRAAGYDNEGAFAALEEDDLCTPGLWIPRKSRVRIMTLAGAVGRRAAVFDTAKGKNNYKTIEKENLSASTALAVEGDDKIYTTKAELQRAWAQREADAEAARLAVLNKDKPRDHSPQIQELIDRIRRDTRVDEDGLSLNHRIMKAPTSYCCVRHEHEAIQVRKMFVEKRKTFNVFDLENYLRRVDTSSNGFIPREVLGVIVQESLKKNFHNPLSQFELDRLLNACLMSADEQLANQDWAGEKERIYNLGRIPIPLYDTRRFVRLTVNIIAEKDKNKFVDCVSVS